MTVPGWDCADGTPEEDHDWRFVAGDCSVGEGDHVECAQCGEERDVIFGEYPSAELVLGVEP